MNRQRQLDRLCREHGLLAVYLFGSRADDGLRLLQGETVSGEGSDLDVGIVFRGRGFDPSSLYLISGELEDIFSPLRVDVVPLQRVDAIFQFSAIDGHRIATTEPEEADLYELAIMSRAEELLPIQRQLELERFGVSTT